MNKVKIGLIISCLILIAGAIMKIMHIQYGGFIFLFGFIAGGIFTMINTYLLQKRIKELEEKTQ